MDGRILIDSQVVLWLLTGDRHMGRQAKTKLSAARLVYVSAASIWELTIKAQSGKLILPGDLTAEMDNSHLVELEISHQHAVGIGEVCLPHNDPFDRLLLSQARAEGLLFMTADQILLDQNFSFVIDARR